MIFFLSTYAELLWPSPFDHSLMLLENQSRYYRKLDILHWGILHDGISAMFSYIAVIVIMIKCKVVTA